MFSLEVRGDKVFYKFRSVPSPDWLSSIDIIKAFSDSYVNNTVAVDVSAETGLAEREWLSEELMVYMMVRLLYELY